MSKPYFETVKSFADVPVTDDGVETVSFLEASEGLIQMFDLFGSAVFGFVQTDLKGNFTVVRDRYQANEPVSPTLEKLVEAEARDGHRNATGSLVRLLRGLLLTCQALQHMQNDSNLETHVCFKRSYDTNLRHHHAFVVRTVVSVAIRAVPRRSDFYACIAQGGPRDKLDQEMAKWLEGLDAIVKRMREFLEKGNYGKV